MSQDLREPIAVGELSFSPSETVTPLIWTELPVSTRPKRNANNGFGF
jgi:hypothetical protein